MQIRPYTPTDDAALMQIELQSPRGTEAPFVHYRRRFVDRTRLFAEGHLFTLVDGDQVGGCIAVALKTVRIAGQAVRVAYDFDLRVTPAWRRRGLGLLLLDHAAAFARGAGAVGLYGAVVSTNAPSLKLLEGTGYTRLRPVRYLEFDALPASEKLDLDVRIDQEDDDAAHSALAGLDFYAADTVHGVRPYGYRRYWAGTGADLASMSGFAISQIYAQVHPDQFSANGAEPVDTPRTLRLFHPRWGENPDVLQSLLSAVRVAAFQAGYQALTMALDAEDPVAAQLHAQATRQKAYWLVYKALDPGFEAGWRPPFYIDPREL